MKNNMIGRSSDLPFLCPITNREQVVKLIKERINWYIYDIRKHWNDSHWNRLCGYSIIGLFIFNIVQFWCK
jgi:hypothetical protein